MPFYDDLARSYGMPGMELTPGAARDMFLSGLAANGSRMLERSMAPARPPQSPMASEVLNQMQQQEWVRQQKLAEIERQQQQMQVQNQMAQQQMALKRQQEARLQSGQAYEQDPQRIQEQIDVVNARVGGYGANAAEAADRQRELVLLQERLRREREQAGFDGTQGLPLPQPKPMSDSERRQRIQDLLDPKKNPYMTAQQRNFLLSELEKSVGMPDDIQSPTTSPVLERARARALDNREDAVKDGLGLGEGSTDEWPQFRQVLNKFGSESSMIEDAVKSISQMEGLSEDRIRTDLAADGWPQDAIDIAILMLRSGDAQGAHR